MTQILWLFFIITNGIPLEITKKCVLNALYPTMNDCLYPEISASQALIELRDKWVVFMGESTLRQLYLQMIGIIDSKPWNEIKDRKKDPKIEIRKSGSRFTFYYYPYYDNITLNLKKPPKLYDGRSPDLIILNDGLHDLLYNFKKMDVAWTQLSSFLKDFTKNYQAPILWIPAGYIHDDHLTKHRKDDPNFKNATLYQKVLIQKKTILSLPNAMYYDVFKNIEFDKFGFDGIHAMERARKESEGLIGVFHYLNKDPNIWEKDFITPGQIMCFMVGTIVTIIVFTNELLIKFCKKPSIKISGNDVESKGLLDSIKDDNIIKNNNTNNNVLNGVTKDDVTIDTKDNTDNKKDDDTKINNNEQNQLSQSRSIKSHAVIEYEINLNDGLLKSMLISYQNNKTIWRQAFLFSLTLFIIYLTDGPKHNFVMPSLKHYNRDYFIFLHIIFLIISWLTLKENINRKTNKPDYVILSRLQTEEWKGIMQIIFVMYHYYDAAEVYNMIRVFIGAYVWMTGFGNTLFFVNKKIFNLTRLFGMLLRLNWLVFWVCMLLNERLMLYYICPLHTFFFLMTYITWGLFNNTNKQFKWQCIKLVICFLFLFILYDVLPVSAFYTFWSPMKWLFNYHGTLYEWNFRTRLDHYATWLGMVCGIFFESITKYMDFIQNKPKQKYIIIIIVIISLMLWYKYVYILPKYDYNSIHPYTSFIPIFSYIILRNIFKESRPYYSYFLAKMGTITLETYIFQYHVYMIDDAKSILTIIHGYPYTNFLLVSGIYTYLSYIAFEATNHFRNYFYPVRKDLTNKTVLIDTIKYIIIITSLYGISYIIWYMQGNQ